MTASRVEIPLHRVSPFVWVVSSWCGSVGLFVVYLVATGAGIRSDEHHLHWIVAILLATVLLSSPLALAWRQLSRLVVSDNYIYIYKSHVPIRGPEPISVKEIELIYANGVLRIARGPAPQSPRAQRRSYQFYVNESIFPFVADDALGEGAVIRGVSYNYTDAVRQLRFCQLGDENLSLELPKSQNGARLIKQSQNSNG